jgi:hypothetical protein
VRSQSARSDAKRITSAKGTAACHQTGEELASLAAKGCLVNTYKKSPSRQYRFAEPFATTHDRSLNSPVRRAH